MNKKNEAKKLQEEMMEVVKSDEAKKVLEEGLKNLDPKALTSEGIIQTYKIDYESIKHNPMGGINLTAKVNDDEMKNIEFNIEKQKNILVIDGMDLSSDLSKFLKEHKHD